VHVVIGELVPKGIALGHSEGVALALAAPVRAFFTLFAPFVWILRRSTEWVLKVLGLEPPGAEVDAMSEAELRMLLTRSTEQGEIEQDERGMIEKVFDFADKDAADVMIPRPEVVAISISTPPEDALAAVIDSPYTRYPVYRETVDNVVGILHVRDLFSAVYEKGIENVGLEALLRSAHVVPETKDLASLLSEFRRTNTHFAIVVDEYGAMAGILTLEDLIEEIVGEIEDEFDVAEVQIEQIASAACSRSTSSTTASARRCPTRTSTPSAATSSGSSGGWPRRATTSPGTASDSTSWRSRGTASSGSASPSTSVPLRGARTTIRSATTTSNRRCKTFVTPRQHRRPTLN
jgi:CBS domain containing-hemolysin-like protein